ncbi:unnamed protein product [Lupinus luteus]|uniref:Uncharacterized protein n=1 Tax=Lupinus luteus TaxID=3873 RepID=A0AAV1XIJ1_LUPLU
MKFLNFDQQLAGEKRITELHQLDELRLQAYNSSEIYKERIKRYHDHKIVKRNFEADQQVLLFNSRLKLFPGKLKSKWSGPFIIKCVNPSGAIELENPASKRHWIVNGQRIKPYLGGDIQRLIATIQLCDP